MKHGFSDLSAVAIVAVLGCGRPLLGIVEFLFCFVLFSCSCMHSFYSLEDVLQHPNRCQQQAPNCDNHKCLQTVPNVPWGRTSWMRITARDRMVRSLTGSSHVPAGNTRLCRCPCYNRSGPGSFIALPRGGEGGQGVQMQPPPCRAWKPTPQGALIQALDDA